VFLDQRFTLFPHNSKRRAYRASNAYSRGGRLLGHPHFWQFDMQSPSKKAQFLKGSSQKYKLKECYWTSTAKTKTCLFLTTFTLQPCPSQWQQTSSSAQSSVKEHPCLVCVIKNKECNTSNSVVALKKKKKTPPQKSTYIPK